MNTVQSGGLAAGAIKNYPNVQKLNVEEKPDLQSKSTAKKPANLKAADAKNALAKANTKAAEEKAGEKDQLGINDYLKIVSRLENKLSQGEISDEDLKQITDSLETKILSLNDAQKARLRKLDLFKKNGIDNIKELKKTLVEMFNDVNKREELFEFLKSPEFMGVLVNEPGQALTYSAPASPKAVIAPKS